MKGIFKITLLFCLQIWWWAIKAKYESFIDEPYSIYWNVPTLECKLDYGININLTQYGVKENTANWTTDGGIVGEKISIFYAPGKWPHYLNDKPQYGGIPQLGNLTDHLLTLRSLLDSTLPRDFSGVAVLDYEIPSPSWDLVMYVYGPSSPYVQMSIDLVRDQHPEWGPDQVMAEAERQYNQSIRLFYEQTILTAREVRPRAWWSFYGVPFCSQKNMNHTCPDVEQQLNQGFDWMFKVSDVLAPSFYFKTGANLTENMIYASNLINEAHRIRKVIGMPYQPILMYTTYQVFPNGTSLYTLAQLVYSIGQAADLGTEGVVVWAKGATGKQGCVEVKTYIDDMMGPYMAEVLSFTNFCSRTLCNSHGRCALKYTPSNASQKATELLSKFRKYSIRSAGKLGGKVVEDIHNSKEDKYNTMNAYNEVVKKQSVINEKILEEAFYELLGIYKKAHPLNSDPLVEIYQCHCYERWYGDHCDIYI